MVHRRTSADFHLTSSESLAGLPRRGSESELHHRKTGFPRSPDRYLMFQAESAQIVGGVENQSAKVLGPIGACKDEISSLPATTE